MKLDRDAAVKDVGLIVLCLTIGAFVGSVATVSGLWWLQVIASFSG